MMTYQPQAGSADDRATDFKAVEGDTGEHLNGYTLMVEAYAAIWLIVLVWIALLWRKQASLSARIDGLEGALVRAERSAKGTKPKAENAPAVETAS